MSISKTLFLNSVLLLPTVSHAQSAVTKASAEAASFVDKLNDVIIYPTIILLSAIALLIFIWGVAEYFMNADNDMARQTGVQHMTWGIIGLVIMVSAFTILQIVVSTFGLGDELDCADDPSLAGCEDKFKVTPPPFL
jgi:hypothetical protein